MIDIKRILAGAVGGFASAIVVDLNAWSRSKSGKFNWGLAAKRWLAGAASGAAAGLGLGGLG